METPLQISFHGINPSAAMEGLIRNHAEELEKFFDRIVSCRVSLEAPPRHQHQGGPFRVSIEIGVPGHTIVVGRAPAHDVSHADAGAAVNDAFRAAGRQLEDYARRMRGDVKTHFGSSQGRVTIR